MDSSGHRIDFFYQVKFRARRLWVYLAARHSCITQSHSKNVCLVTHCCILTGRKNTP
jgi:hypothetical protein